MESLVSIGTFKGFSKQPQSMANVLVYRSSLLPPLLKSGAGLPITLAPGGVP